MDQQQAVTLVEYNSWANRRVLVKAARLPADALLAPAGLSHQSVMGTLVHMLDTQWYWREGAQNGMLPTARLSLEDFPDIAALRRRWEGEDRQLLDFVSDLSEGELAGSVEYRWTRARPRTRPLWHILQHIGNHSTHHRSEIGLYLATQGQSPGDLDFIKFVGKADHQAGWTPEAAGTQAW